MQCITCKGTIAFAGYLYNRRISWSMLSASPDLLPGVHDQFRDVVSEATVVLHAGGLDDQFFHVVYFPFFQILSKHCRTIHHPELWEKYNSPS